MTNSRYIVRAVFNGTGLNIPVSAMSVDAAMLKLRKKRLVKNASVFLFYSRKTGKFVECRGN